MDIPKFKDVIQKASFLKNYSSLLVPIVIVLIAVFLFIPTRLMSGKLKQRVANESISKRGKKVKSLGKSAVSREQWKLEEEYQQVHEKDANQIVLLAKQSSRRQLLSYKIFPEPKDTSMLIFEEFGQQFRSSIDELIVRLNARDCPTDAELEKSLQGSGVSGSSQRGARSSGRSSRRISEVSDAIREVLCQEKAKSASVYVNPEDLSGYRFWEEYEYVGMKAAIEDCWYWQLAYWIVEDVVETIDALNSGSNSVFTSPLKRLVGVSFSTGGDGSRSGSRDIMVDDRPGYVLSAGDGLTNSYTGLVCNSDIDVVHFNIVVVVDTKAFLPFIQQLCSAKQHNFEGFFADEPEQLFKRNQITILESKITPVDREDEEHELYRYGDTAVVELNLVCEYVFNNRGYDKIKPESIKRLTEPEEQAPKTRKRSSRGRRR